MPDQARIRSWRKRAEELRAAAENVKDPMARRGMLNAAASYDRLADAGEAGRRQAVALPGA